IEADVEEPASRIRIHASKAAVISIEHQSLDEVRVPAQRPLGKGIGELIGDSGTYAPCGQQRYLETDGRLKNQIKLGAVYTRIRDQQEIVSGLCEVTAEAILPRQDFELGFAEGDLEMALPTHPGQELHQAHPLT